ncbi:MAG TPA: hypothetical protein VMT76_01720 [Puia sp.]|nr:hypothetical protein [Puia sp.]
MNTKPINKIFLFAFFFSVISLLAALIFGWNKLGENAHFNLVIILIALRYVLLIAAILLIAFRLLKLSISSNSTLYISISVLNILVGSFSLVFYFFHRVNIWWLNLTLLNLLFGLLMVLDMLVFPRRRTIS